MQRYYYCWAVRFSSVVGYFICDAIKITQQRPTLPCSEPHSTIGDEGLDFRVRDGNGYFPLSKATENFFVCSSKDIFLACDFYSHSEFFLIH